MGLGAGSENAVRPHAPACMRARAMRDAGSFEIHAAAPKTCGQMRAKILEKISKPDFDVSKIRNYGPTNYQMRKTLDFVHNFHTKKLQQILNCFTKKAKQGREICVRLF